MVRYSALPRNGTVASTPAVDLRPNDNAFWIQDTSMKSIRVPSNSMPRKTNRSVNPSQPKALFDEQQEATFSLLALQAWSPATAMAPQQRNRLYIAGGPGGNSIGPAVHEYIAKSLGLDWTCEFLRMSSIDDVMRLYRAADFAGGLVTMPHKRTIIPLLDQCDELVKILGACNMVYLTADQQLCGSNTDWVGIYDAILARKPDNHPGKIGLVYGAGGASRAAIYALSAKLRCRTIYLVNRDDQEVAEVLRDVREHGDVYKPQIVHVRKLSEAKELEPPHYIVSTVPDFEAVTAEETQARNILTEFLQRPSPSKGLLLDMCYHPPMTRNLKLAKDSGWSIVQGFTVVACQFRVQWELWTGKAIQTDEVFRLTEKLIRDRDEALPLVRSNGYH